MSVLSRFDRLLDHRMMFAMFCILLMAFSSESKGCENITGVWRANYSGAIAGQGILTLSEVAPYSYSAVLDLSKGNEKRLLRGTAVCDNHRLIIQVGGLNNPLSNLKVIGGTLVTVLDPEPIDTPFGAWVMHVINLNDFDDMELKGFWRMSRVNDRGAVDQW